MFINSFNRRQRTWRVCAVALLFGAINTQGMFMFVETTNVPIARLLANLVRRLAQGSNEFEVHYDLARVYSMPSATNVEVKVQDDRPFPDLFQLPPSQEPREVYRSAGLQEQKGCANREARC